MASVIIYSVCAIIAITSTVSGEEGGTCRACNCQFNNVEVLDQLIESKIASGKLAIITIKLQWYQDCRMYMHVQCISRVLTSVSDLYNSYGIDKCA